MKHNFKKLAEEGKAISEKHTQRELTLTEFQDLVQESLIEFKGKEGTYNVISRLLNIGIAMGYRMAKGEAEEK